MDIRVMGDFYEMNTCPPTHVYPDSYREGKRGDKRGNKNAKRETQNAKRETRNLKLETKTL